MSSARLMTTSVYVCVSLMNWPLIRHDLVLITVDVKNYTISTLHQSRKRNAFLYEPSRPFAKSM